uniref:Uncharacterized protein n=1 Tax=Chromera velia CCMP2878 TaxID=1169474 RepID=A0A0G4FJL4_9ALVE|eukprot:Cvel_17377.t1-p1 / transcript=Cvel_17377.t1 / gene=Cvel_17377 / organism=Chromera_velia_CCMP2878 / gene_product=hypothetical protein / transcript_product=hypothetical protein / location=Cvel_scaffold1382:2792-3424(-) / protein_length=211 / sequence_SO=supercontig / SO=protein_coding / is_pseudo=false
MPILWEGDCPIPLRTPLPLPDFPPYMPVVGLEKALQMLSFPFADELSTMFLNELKEESQEPSGVGAGRGRGRGAGALPAPAAAGRGCGGVGGGEGSAAAVQQWKLRLSDNEVTLFELPKKLLKAVGLLKGGIQRFYTLLGTLNGTTFSLLTPDTLKGILDSLHFPPLSFNENRFKKFLLERIEQSYPTSLMKVLCFDTSFDMKPAIRESRP